MIATYKSLAMIFAVSIVSGGSVRKIGPYEIDIKYFEKCGEDRDYMQFDWRMQRYNRSMLTTNTTLTLTAPIDDRIKIESNFAVMTNQGWKYNFFTTNYNNMGFCQLWKMGTSPEQYAETLANFNPPVKECPIPPGTYKPQISNYLPTFPLAPVFTYNKYKIRVRFMDENKIERFCLLAFVDVVPKRMKVKEKENFKKNESQLTI